MKKLYLIVVYIAASSLAFSQTIINEICYDPSNSGLNGDTNGDGAYAQSEDEFIELYNTSSTNLDISGYEFYDAENLVLGTPNHTVPAGTVIPPGGVYVLFGGGTPTGTFGGAVVQTSTFGDLNLNNAGDTLYIFDANGNGVDTFDIEPLSNNPNESYTRYPDITGPYIQHGDSTPVLFSPGTRVDGTPFNTDYVVETITVQGQGGVSTISTPGGTLQMEAMVLPSFAADTTVTWSLGTGAANASIGTDGMLTAQMDGMVTVIATANDGSGVSDSADITITGQNTSLGQTIGEPALTMYPNPASTVVTLQTEKLVSEVEVFTLQGVRLSGFTVANKQVDIQRLPSGMYVLRALVGDTWFSGRILVK